MEMLLELHSGNGKTIVMVTHDESLSGYADRIIHLRDGRIIEGGI